MNIKLWPPEDRPREKLLREGEHRLSNTELLAILLRTGVKGQSALDLARKVLDKFKNFRNMAHTGSNAWKEFKGLGLVKLAQIRAAIEIGRRLTEEGFSEDRPKVVSAKDVATMLGPRLRDLKKEVFKAVLLNPQNRVIDTQEITCGTVDQAFPISREIFHAAIEKFAAALICVHNHPSGNCRPSLEDKFFTTELVNAGKTLNIRVLDHIIIAGDGYFSFKDEGLI